MLGIIISTVTFVVVSLIVGRIFSHFEDRRSAREMADMIASLKK